MDKPLIGITCAQDTAEQRYWLREYYVHVIEKCGGIPIILPPVEVNNIAKHIETVSGLILSGGVDVDPVFFGSEPLPGCGEITPERDYYEIELVKKYLETAKPLLAICRGLQVLNIACGGFIYQDIYSELDGPLLKHSQLAPKWHATHSISLQKNSILHNIFAKSALRVNSFHHQAVSIPAKDFEIVAKSPDGIVEAIEHKFHPFTIGIQWHPECMAEKNRDQMQLFEKFVKYCKESRN
ncbi:MAG: putative glutamine amidotransferase [Clostridia bacterium]|nr:putative glutamine amidotransferase [Clostridia bacterium]